MSKFLVVGDDGINSLSIVRGLGFKGITPDVIVTSNEQYQPYITKSKFIGKCITVEKNAVKIFDEMSKYLASTSEKIYVFPTTDYVVMVLSDYSEKLDNRFVLPSVTAENGKIKTLMSKALMAEYAKKAGFDVPFTVKKRITKQIVNDDYFLESFEEYYPLILKADSILSSIYDFEVVGNKEELKDSLHQFIDNEIVIQQYIEGAQEVSISGVSLSNGDKCGVFGYVKKIRTSVASRGTTTYAKIIRCNDSKPFNLVRSFVRTIGYCGIFDIEMLIADEKVYFIECNYRNGSYGFAHILMGANLPYIWYSGVCDKSEDFDPETGLKLRKETKFTNDIGDFLQIKKGNLNPIKFMWQYLTADAHLLYYHRDMGPFWAEIKGKMKKGKK